MARFLVPVQLAPGIVRQRRCWPVDSIVDFNEEEAHPQLIPLDDVAYSMLVKKYGPERIKGLHGDGPKELVKPPAQEDAATLRELYEQAKMPEPGVTVERTSLRKQEKKKGWR